MDLTRSDRSALLVMDVQRGIVGRFGDDDAYLQRLGDRRLETLIADWKTEPPA